MLGWKVADMSWLTHLEGCGKSCLGVNLGVGHNEDDGGRHEQVQCCDYTQRSHQTHW